VLLIPKQNPQQHPKQNHAFVLMPTCVCVYLCVCARVCVCARRVEEVEISEFLVSMYDDQWSIHVDLDEEVEFGISY